MTDKSDIHAAAVQRALALLGPFHADWVTSRPDADANVTIVGAGQSGLALAFSLRRIGVGKVRIIDAAREGHEGIWSTRARMPTLRTPKINPGPELGIGELGFQAWYEREYEPESFADLVRPSTSDWSKYLTWYRKALAIDVDFETQLSDVRPENQFLRLTLDGPDGRREIVSRKLVLANGFAGGGRPFVPAVIAESLPSGLYAHSIDLIDPARFKGKRVGIVGASASAFDHSGAALENGAKEVRLFSRGKDLVRVARFMSAAYPGGDYFVTLSDRERWELATRYLERGSPPPIDSVVRSTGHENFHLHLGAPVDGVRHDRGVIMLTTGREQFELDYLVAATGFEINLDRRPELSSIIGEAATWGDRYSPPDVSFAHLLKAPYLRPSFSLEEKMPGGAPHLHNIHVFNGAGFVSFGRILGDVLSIRRLLPRLSEALAADLFQQDRQAHVVRLQTDLPPEGLAEDHFLHRIWRPTAFKTGLLGENSHEHA
ncbi:NAD(P)-binding domain-containing protein (plasmid) [Microvirga sp. RSM25]|uniref:NAD(P)-binding domain-containing protein n=1 Tax=Microvirga sp. RSM25 TaxID=3273802 RepID=UPI00384A4CCD